MKAYTVTSSKEGITVVANSKAKAEELVRRDNLLDRTMDGHLKVEIDRLVTNIELEYEDDEVVGAILTTRYAKEPFSVPAELW